MSHLCHVFVERALHDIDYVSSKSLLSRRALTQGYANLPMMESTVKTLSPHINRGTEDTRPIVVMTCGIAGTQSPFQVSSYH